jgi:hypothetical protein
MPLPVGMKNVGVERERERGGETKMNQLEIVSLDAIPDIDSLSFYSPQQQSLTSSYESIFISPQMSSTSSSTHESSYSPSSTHESSSSSTCFESPLLNHHSSSSSSHFPHTFSQLMQEVHEMEREILSPDTYQYGSLLFQNGNESSQIGDLLLGITDVAFSQEGNESFQNGSVVIQIENEIEFTQPITPTTAILTELLMDESICEERILQHF